MMEHIDDDDYFQKKLESTAAALKRKEMETAGSPLTVDPSKKQRSVEDYCDDSDLIRWETLIRPRIRQSNLGYHVGRGCSTVVERTPHNLEVKGLNPTGC